MNSGKATTKWSIPEELHKFHLARADQLTFDQPIPQYIQHGDEVPHRLARLSLFRNQVDRAQTCMRFINLLDPTGKLLLGILALPRPGPVSTLAVWIHHWTKGF